MLSSKTILTYGTFDLFHVGHLNLLKRLAGLGERLIVGVSTDEFNATKGKRTIVPFEHRAEIVSNLRFVDHVIPEFSWEQKKEDIRENGVGVLGMGADWAGKFDHLKSECEVLYLPRTEGVSSTDLKRLLAVLDRSHVDDLKRALDIISVIVERFE